MGRYHYDESGSLAAYFLLTFLSIVLVPLSISIAPSSGKRAASGCQCRPCREQRSRIYRRENGSWLKPKIGARTAITIVGWAAFAYLAYKASTTPSDAKVYDPFEILGIRASATMKEIRSHYKKLSKQFHPDKVKIVGNDTIEAISNRFVDFTKAYKSLTDDTIRENLVKFGHPDGQQETSMGIALPQWIVEGQNNIWVLGVYGLLFGGALPALVGRWWFGSRQKTRDGVSTDTAAAFFKSLKEESELPDVVAALGKAAEWDRVHAKAKAAHVKALDALDARIVRELGEKWTELKALVLPKGESHAGRRQALVLLYAHLLRIPISDAVLQKEQTRILLQTPALLNALLNVSMSRNWLQPTLATMRLHGYLAQALAPAPSPAVFAQLPHVDGAEVQEIAPKAEGMEDFVAALEKRGDGRVGEVKTALKRWGRVELVDASFKVIDERIVTPASIVFLIVKLRLSPPGAAPAAADADKAKAEADSADESVDEAKRRAKASEKVDYEFLTSKYDAEVLPQGTDDSSGYAHAPYWPTNRKPGWWLFLADEKLNKVVFPPIRIADIPFAGGRAGGRDYRAYKLQFQAPQGVGMYTWKMFLVSDTFVGEEIEKSITLKVDDMSALTAEERGAEDEISDPEEDSLAGQMAALRGGAVKPSRAGAEDEDDDESGTDDDDEEEEEGSSDSD